MNLYDAEKAIKQRWMTLWPGLSSNVPYVFDNDVQDSIVTTYARVSVTSNGSLKLTVGNQSKKKRNLIIAVKLNGPVNAGSKGVSQLVPFVQTVFEEKRFGGVGISDGVVCEIMKPYGGSSDGRFWTMLLTFDAHFIE
jgi:hypothetical protein